MLATAPALQFQFRPGTQDRDVFQEVVQGNCYHLPHFFAPDDIIIDGGAHIGSFAVACAGRGARRIHCYEPDRDNFRYLTGNTNSLIGVRRRQCALWRSDCEEEVCFSGYPEGSTCCGTVLPNVTVGGQNKREPVATVSLDEAIREATDDGKERVRLLKLDIEGSEFIVLGTSKRLDLVDEIIGEVHEGLPGSSSKMKRFDAECLSEYLADQGFSVSVFKEAYWNAPKLKLISARR